MEDKVYQNSSSQDDEPRDAALQRLRSSNTVTMSPDLFEKLYLQPMNPVKGDLRKTFGNPTPLGILGFVIGLTPLACCLIGWRGSGGLGAANIGVFYFIGAPCLIIAGVLEFFLGNTFPYMVFTTYGCIFLALAATLHPFYASAAAYSPTGNFAEGLTSPGFNASVAFFPIAIAIMNLWFMICATKVNAVFCTLFFGAGLGFILLAAAFFATAEGSMEAAGQLMVGTGSCWFFTSMVGWYLLLAQLLGVMGFKMSLPVGDFSGFWAKRQAKNNQHMA